MPPPHPDLDELHAFCIAQIATLINMPPEQIDSSADLASLGLDSATSVHLVLHLEDRLQIELEPELIFDHPTVDILCQYLLTRLG